MFYVIQENVFRESHYDLLIEFLKKYNLEHEIIKFKPFIHEIEHSTDRKDVWCWGSVSMARAAEKYGWKPGSMYNSNHDFEIYMLHYGKNLLNWDGEIMNLTDPLPSGYELFFARPTKDTKSFTGQVFWDYSWNEWVAESIENKTSNLLMAETRVLIAPLREIQQEVRCWVVDGKVISASRYKLGNRVSYQNYDDESFFVDFAQKMVDIYQPAKAFVIDVCLSNDELKIVEINCINCAGFYHVNMNKLMEAIETAFS